MRRPDDLENNKKYVSWFMMLVYPLLVLVMAGLCSCGGGGGGSTSSASTPSSAPPKVLSSISVEPADNHLAIGKTQQFIVIGRYSDGSTDTQSAAVSWSSSLTSVATITSSGMVTALAAGQTTITAAVGSLSGSTTLIVPASTLVSLTITPTNPTIAINTTKQFAAAGAFSDGSFQDLSSTVTWSSSDTSKVTISTNGMATAVSAGSAIITAALGSTSVTTSLIVSPATLVSLAVTPSNPSIAAGTTQQFSATGTFSDSTTQNLTTSVTWGSSATSIATVSSSGKANAVAVGPVTITATLGASSAATVLTVTPAVLVTISVTPSNPGISAGMTQQFSALGTFSDSTTQDLTASATWSSSAIAIASITQNGLATAVSVGTATISAVFGGVTGLQTLNVTPVVVSGTWGGTYTIYDAVDRSEIGTYTYRFILSQSGVSVTGSSSLRYDTIGQIRADGVFLEGTVTGRQFDFIFSYIDPRTLRNMVNIGSATIGTAVMTGNVLENNNAGYNCSYIFSLNKL